MDRRKKVFVYDNYSKTSPIKMGSLFVDFIKDKEVFSFEFDELYLEQADKSIRFDPDLNYIKGRQYSYNHNVFGFVVKKSTRLDNFFNFIYVGICKSFNIWIFFKKSRGYHIHTLICALGRKNNRNNKFIVIFKVQFAHSLWKLLFQNIINFACVHVKILTYFENF